MNNNNILLSFSTAPDGRLRVTLKEGPYIETLESAAPYPSFKEPMRFLVASFFDTLREVLQKKVCPEHTMVFYFPTLEDKETGLFCELGYPGEFLARCDGKHRLGHPKCVDSRCWLGKENPLCGVRIK